MNFLNLILLTGCLFLITACPKPTAVEELSLPPGRLEISIDTLDFRETDRATFTLKNIGQDRLTWEISNLATLRWVNSFSPSSGTVAGGASIEISLTIDRDKLQAGTNQDTVDLKSGSPETVKFVIIKAFLKTAEPPPDPPKDKLTGFDPFYKDQWYLENTGQFGGKAGIDINVKAAWEQGYLGTGIKVGILDAPVDHTHPDLKDNLTADRVQDFAKQPCDAHGTNVAGVIAARDNGIGIQGIAPRVNLYSCGVINSDAPDEAENGFYTNIIKALESPEHAQIAVYNASIGPRENTYEPPNKGITAAFEKVIWAGLGGLGGVMVFSAGNIGNIGTSNNNLFLNHYATIAVNSVLKTGSILDQFGGTQGANLWLLGPTAQAGSEYITTDNVGACGEAGDYEQNFSSTSGAAPMVTGTVALIRQANPKLTWRDVKLILAESANKTPTSGQTYQITGKMYSDPAKDQMYENRSGFGIVDATAAVNLAKVWTLLPLMKTFEAETTTEVSTTPKNIFHTSPLTVSGSDLTYIESVTLIMTVEKGSKEVTLTQWDLHLVNPEGKEAIIYYKDSSAPFRNMSYLRDGIDTMHLLVNHFLGNKTINGRWELKIRQSQDSGIMKIKSWKIVVRGH